MQKSYPSQPPIPLAMACRQQTFKRFKFLCHSFPHSVVKLCHLKLFFSHSPKIVDLLFSCVHVWKVLASPSNQQGEQLNRMCQGNEKKLGWSIITKS